ncbi:EamA family transporter [Gemmatimonadota bacterium]
MAGARLAVGVGEGHPDATSFERTGWTPRIVLALAGLYFIWGSTYLAIRIAIDTLPPLLMGAVRFLLAGGILFAWAGSRGAPVGTLRQWRTSAISGILMLAGGNGAVVWAEQFVPSGLVSLLVATVPLWILLLDWLFGSGGRPGGGILFGIIWGFLGVALLFSGAEIGQGTAQDLLGGLLVLGGAVAWATGSLVVRYGSRPRSPGMGTAIQMLAGGTVLLFVAAARGEPAMVDLGSVSAASVGAFLYLVVLGSLVGFSSYVWLLRRTSPAVASTYAYANPVVALFLGWAFAGEPLGSRTFLAAFVILTSVVIITARRVSRAPW